MKRRHKYLEDNKQLLELQNLEPPLKRFKKEGVEIHEPTKVLLLRGISPFVSQRIIRECVNPIGEIEDLIYIPPKGLAFIQFKDLFEAVKFYGCLKHKSTTNENTKYLTSKLSNGNSQGVNVNYSGKKVIILPKKSSCLLITLVNSSEFRLELANNQIQTKFPPDINKLKAYFQKLGSINNLYLFPKMNCWQGFVETESIEEAENMILKADGNQFSNYKIHLQYSKRSELIFKGEKFSEKYTEMQKSIVHTYDKPTNRVILIKHNIGDLTPNMLFNLFELYGTVWKIKLFSQKKFSLIEFVEGEQAYMAVLHLNNLTIWAKNQYIPPSRNINKLNCQFANYEDSKEHRYIYYKSKYPYQLPKRTLFIARLPKDITETELCKYFDINNSEFIIKLYTEKAEALVNFGTISLATEMLMKYHNSIFLDSKICIQFARVDLSKRANRIPDTKELHKNV